jgi:hypothetical protein
MISIPKGRHTMTIRIMRVDDFGVSIFEMQKSRPKGILQRFVLFIEKSDWDDHCMKHIKRAERMTLIATGAATLCLAILGLRMLW